MIQHIETWQLPPFPTTTEVTVNVTRADIWRAKMATTNECAVALALRRALGIDSVSVGVSKAHVVLDGRLYRFTLPQIAERKIHALVGAEFFFGPIGRSLFVRPFSFKLTLG